MRSELDNSNIDEDNHRTEPEALVEPGDTKLVSTINVSKGTSYCEHFPQQVVKNTPQCDCEQTNKKLFAETNLGNLCETSQIFLIEGPQITERGSSLSGRFEACRSVTKTIL